MARTTLKPTNMYGNIYEEAHSRLSKNLFFNQNDWTNFAKGEGNLSLDMYADVLEKTESWSAAEIDKFYKDYNYTYADDTTRSAALYNEVYGDRTNTDVERERYLRDANGNLVLENGEPVIEKFKASDYDYYKSVINERHNEIYNDWLHQQEVERKESMSGFVKFLGDVASAGGEFVLGITDMVDGVISSAAGLSAMIDTAVKGGKWEDVASAFVETVSNDDYRLFEDLHDPLIEFEKRYTHLRDLDGNFTNVGKYVVGISNTLGQMVPSMGVGKLIGSIGKAGTIGKNGLLTVNAIKTGATAVNTAATAASAMSQIVYYQGMHSNNIRDMYTQFAAEGVSVANSQILYNGTIKATAEYLVEIGLSKMLGGSIFDDVVFGRSQGKSLGKNLTKSGIARVLKSAGQEGLEEVLQETSTFLVDYAWPKAWSENFGENAELTWQTLFDSFIIGALVSFGGSARAVLGTSGKGFSGKTALNRKLAAYEYGVNMQSFVKSYNEIMHYKGDTKASTYQRAATQMYASYRMVASVYGEMGETRFKAATKLLDTITSDIEAGKFDSNKMKSLAQGVYDTIFGEKSMSAEISAELKKKVEEAELANTIVKLERGEEVSDEYGTDIKNAIEKAFSFDKNLSGLSVTKDGHKPVGYKDNDGKWHIAVPVNLIKNSEFSVTETSIMEDKIVEDVLKGEKIYGLQFNKLLKMFKDLTGLENATTSRAIWSLMFDDNVVFFNAALHYANKDMQKFLSSLIKTLQDVSVNSITDVIYRAKLSKIITKMKQSYKTYLINHPLATYPDKIFNAQEVSYIANRRYTRKIGTKIIFGEKLTESERKSVDERIENANVDDGMKYSLRQSLYSSKLSDREYAIRKLDAIYEYSYYSDYDGKQYLPETSPANTSFNTFLKNNNLTISTFLDENVLNEEEVTLVKEKYKGSLFAYRKDMYERSVNERYTFKTDSTGNVTVFEKSTNEAVGYTVYHDYITNENNDYSLQYVKYKQGVKDVQNKTNIESTLENSNITKKLLKSDLPSAVSNMITINDIVKNPDYLNNDIITDIRNEYGYVDASSTFLYLRKKLIKDYGNVSITLLQDGDYAYANIKPLQKMVTKKDFTVGQDCSLSDLPFTQDVKKKYGNIKIKIVNDNNSTLAYYVGKGPGVKTSKGILHVTKNDKNTYVDAKGNVHKTIHRNLEIDTIYVTESVAKNPEYCSYVILHELQHAIQYKLRMNTGSTSNMLHDLKDNGFYKETLSIVKDIMEHVPELFLLCTEPKFDASRKYISDEVLTICDDFLYYGTAESTAYGMDASDMIDFYPILSANGNLTMSWGKTYDIVYGEIKNGINLITARSSEKYEQGLLNLTKEFKIENFLYTPKSLFVMPDGTLRTFDTNEHHYEIISKLTNVFTDEDFKKYFDTIPQVSVQKEGTKYYVSVRITGNMSRSTLNSVLAIMDTLYSKHIEFDLGPIYYKDVDPTEIVVFSDEADNSDELLDLYANEKATARNTQPLYNVSQMVKTKKSEIVNTSKHKYKSKEIVNGKVKYTYERNKNLGTSRYVSQREAKGTPLEPFTKKYEITQMAPELVNFILSTDKNKVAKPLQNKIDKGTLTVQDVMEYFRRTDLSKIDNVTFKAINDAFFHNDIITTPEELQKYLDDTPKYYAARVVLRTQKNLDAIDVDDASFSEALVNAIEALPKNSKDYQLYQRIYSKFFYKGKDTDVSPIDINEKYLKWLWMEHFDGSILQAGRIANIVKYAAMLNRNVAGEVKTKSLEDSVNEDLTLGDTIEDKSAYTDMMDIILNSDKDLTTERLRYKLTKKMFTLIAEKYGTGVESIKSAKKANKILSELTREQLNEVAVKQLLSEVLGLNFDTLDTPNVDKVLNNVERTSRSIVNNILSNVRTIRKNMSPKELKLFLKNNSDIFNEDLKLRPEVYKTTDTKGRQVYKSVDELQPLWDRIRELKDDVKTGAYRSNKALDAFLKNKKAMEDLARKLKQQMNTSKDNVKKAKEVKVVTVNIADDVLEIDTTKPMPKALERILDFEFSKLVKSRTQYLTNDSDEHFQTNFKTFLETNAEYIEALTQEDVNQIIEYYTNSEILKGNISESKYRLYNAVQLYLSVLLLKGNTVGSTNFVLTSEQREALEKRIELTVSSAAQLLSDWKAVMRNLKPEETLINALAKRTGIEFTAEEITEITDAIKSGDVKRIKQAKQNAYEGARKRYSGRKGTFWNKIFQFERICMLSGPGTWVRNVISNRILYGFDVKGKHIPGILDSSEFVGNGVSKLINKMFPKKFKVNVKGQYKISGTKVTQEVKDFLDTWLIKNGFINEIADGLSKYDTRKSKNLTSSEALVNIITKDISTKIFYSNGDNKVYKFVYKMLSDDKYVTKTMLKYLGKMMVEDGVDLSKGLTTEITNLVAEAYVQAARDYMHKPNVWNKIDDAVYKAHPGAYFAWKQVFPFASSSWNWFVEGLNYTPVGLIKSIVNFGKLENTITSLELKRQKGESVVSSRFAEYNAKRNIGKGVIGTVGFVIGALLVAFGVVKLDEEDDVYKITVGDTSVDISGLFSTQGIFMGMSIFQSYRDSKENDDFDFMSMLAESVTLMFNDSTIQDVWDTVRYNNSIGDLFLALPINTINACIPNLFKTISSVSNTRKVKFSQGILGKIEKLAVDAIPGLAYAFPHYIDPYTGEEQVMYKAQFITNLANKLLPLKVYPYNISKTEEEAVNLGVRKTMLSGRYEINDEEVDLSAKDVETLNLYYGKLNKEDLDKLLNDKLILKVKNENGTYSDLRYSKMTEKQKSAAFEQIMSKNSTYAKIYILTSKGYKYYASSSEYQELRKLGITTNVYRKTNKLYGFVKA